MSALSDALEERGGGGYPMGRNVAWEGVVVGTSWKSSRRST